MHTTNCDGYLKYTCTDGEEATMAETPRDRAEQRSQHPQEVRSNPESQDDPPQMPTYEEQHEHEAPGVSADDVKERIGDAEQGGEQGPATKTGREGGE